MFLEQYWGGPADLLRPAGAPSAAHAARPVRIRSVERDAGCAACASRRRDGPDPEHGALLWDYLVMAAHSHGQRLG